MAYENIDIKYTEMGIVINDDIKIPLEGIIENCNKARIKNEEMVVLTIEWPPHRGFDGVVEQIACSITDAKKAISILSGEYVWFGEIAGKHSEICGNIEAEHMNIDGNPDNVLEFISKYPTKHNYDHSFIWQWLEDNENEFLENLIG